MSDDLDQIHAAVLEHVEVFLQNVKEYDKVVHVQCASEKRHDGTKVVVKIFSIGVTEDDEFELRRLSMHVRYLYHGVHIPMLHLHLSMIQAEVEMIYNSLSN